MAYKTFKSAVVRFAETGPLPTQIDRSVLTTMPGGTQGHFLAALRSLGLIDQDSAPTSALQGLLDDLGPGLANVLDAAYPGQALQELRRGTPASLIGALGAGAKGTRTKAALFLVCAAQDAELTVSPHMVDKNGKPRGFGRRSKPRPSKPKSDASNAQGSNPDVGKAERPGREHQELQIGGGRSARLDWPADITPAELETLFKAFGAFRGFFEHQVQARASAMTEQKPSEPLDP